MLVKLSPMGAVTVTAQLLKRTKTNENELVVKLNRANFFGRVNAVAAVLLEADNYVSAAEMLKEFGWFSGDDTFALAAGLEEICDSLADYAMRLNLPVDGMVAVKTETSGNPIQPTTGDDDIPI